MNNEYIERELLLSGEYSFGGKGCTGNCSRCSNWTQSGCQVILDIPTADVAPVVHGEWIIHGVDEHSDLTILQCSNCGRKQFGCSNYCSDCGAKMNGGST